MKYKVSLILIDEDIVFFHVNCTHILLSFNIQALLLQVNTTDYAS